MNDSVNRYSAHLFTCAELRVYQNNTLSINSKLACNIL